MYTKFNISSITKISVDFDSIIDLQAKEIEKSVIFAK